ncbi:beta-lactamase-like protein, partial [Coniella lustricola]
IINTTSWISNIPTRFFFTPVTKGYDRISAPAYSFLVTHPTQHRAILFDLGVRKDWQNLSPANVGLINHTEAHLDVEHNVADILRNAAAAAAASSSSSSSGAGDPAKDASIVAPEDIEAIVWSHWHFDHTGDPSTFPADRTALVVGPGFKEALLPGYPTKPDSLVLDSDFAGRELREIEFDDATKVGRFRAFDYFGDGSFYLLDSPGHAVGHLCGLARVTSGGDSYILMGGDASHHAGEFRPSKWVPLPDEITPNPLGGEGGGGKLSSPSFPSPSPSVCPGSLFDHLLQHGDKTKPFYSIAPGGLSLDKAEAERTVEKLQEADAQHAKVLVVIAHDASLLDVVDFFPKYANDFVAKGWADKARWAFLRDFKEALL